jgi:hypothetical protein
MTVTTADVMRAGIRQLIMVDTLRSSLCGVTLTAFFDDNETCIPWYV